MESMERLIDACCNITGFIASFVSKGIDVKDIYAMLNSASIIAEYRLLQTTEDDLPWDNGEDDEKDSEDSEDLEDTEDALKTEEYAEINRRLAGSQPNTKISVAEIIHTELELRSKALAYLFMLMESMYKEFSHDSICLDCENEQCPANDIAANRFELFCEEIRPDLEELAEAMAHANLLRIKTGTLAPDEVWEHMTKKGEKPEEGAGI